MTTAQHKEAVRRWVAEAWNLGHLELADEMYAPDYAFDDPAAPDMTLRGPEAIKQVLGIYRKAIPDIQFSIDEMIGEGDVVVWRWTAHGTQAGPFGDAPASGRPVTVRGQVMSRFRDGLWASDHINWDTLGLLRQIGVVPSAGAA